MAKKKNQQQELQESAQQIFLAGLGALSKAEDEGSKLFQKLVQRGQRYDGPGKEQFDAIRLELETQLANLRDRAALAQAGADRQAQKARTTVGTQVDKARQSIETVIEGLEGRIETAVTATLQGIGVPTRDEFQALQKQLRQLSRNLDLAKQEQTVDQAATPNVDARATGGGWYEVRVHGLVVDRVRGEDAATTRVEQLRAQDFAGGDGAAPRKIAVEATGGGWYEVKVDGVVVDKVQGRRAADAAVERLEKQA